MSREDQIAWWKAQPKAPPQLKRRMKETISLYNKGKITVGGFVCLVYELAAPDEIEEFVTACPPDLLAALKESLARYGEAANLLQRQLRSLGYAGGNRGVKAPGTAADLGWRLASEGVGPSAKQRLKLTGAAILVFRASTSLQAAPAA
jgi:hypothetical protein